MKSLCVAAAMLVATAGLAAAEPKTLVVTSSNNPAGNQLLVYDGRGKPHPGRADRRSRRRRRECRRHRRHSRQHRRRQFPVRVGSIFDVTDAGVQFRQAIATLSSPVSVAFGKDHLYVLGTTTVESHRLAGRDVTSAPDGSECWSSEMDRPRRSARWRMRC